MTGELRVYVGAAPGVGKTYAMLDELRRRAARGTPVVATAVDPQGRPRTAEQLALLPVLDLTADGDVDVPAVLASGARVVAVDDLARHHAAVDALVRAGMVVLSTVGITEIESLQDVVADIVGAAPATVVPDAVLRDAQVEVVDITPTALRRRLAHGNVVAPDELDVALAERFRPEHLAALRELTLRWAADRVEADAPHGLELREVVAVGVTGAAANDSLVRRARRLADRSHAELVAIHVEGPTATDVDALRQLVDELGGTWRSVSASTDVADALVRTARAEGATQLVLGASERTGRVRGRRDIVEEVLSLAVGGPDVHVVARQSSNPPARRPAHRTRLSPARVAAGFALGLLGVPLLTWVLRVPTSVDLPATLLLYLVLVVAVAAVGGTWPAVATALAASAVANWYFTPPVHHWRVERTDDVVALVVFVAVGALVGTVVAEAARRATDAERARAEAATLARLAATSVGDEPLQTLVDQVRTSFDLDAVAVVDDGTVEAASGGVPTRGDALLTLPLGDHGELRIAGRTLAADDRAVLAVFADHAESALRARRLGREAARVRDLVTANELRTAILNAVSHDLRTPLASIKASVSSLLQDDVEWSTDDVHDFLTTIDTESDRLDGLVGNLLDMSRLQTGSLQVRSTSVGLDEVVPRALAGLGGAPDRVDVVVSESLPRIDADPGLLERAVANVVANALRFAPDGTHVRIEAGTAAGDVVLRVVDRGRGVTADERESMFLPFQRLGDQGGDGVGLGLAVARGFVVAVGGELTAEDTPGGGLTMVFRFPSVAEVLP